MCLCVHTHIYLHISIYKQTHCTSATAQRKSDAWRITGTTARKMEPPRGPNHHVFHSSQGARQEPVDQGFGPSTGGNMGEWGLTERTEGGGTSTVVWRKWKLLCICLRDARVAHGCWDATGGHHAGGHAQALPSHHQRPLLHLLLLLLHLPLPQVLAQDLPLPLRQHLRVDGTLWEKPPPPINNPSRQPNPWRHLH